MTKTAIFSKLTAIFLCVLTLVSIFSISASAKTSGSSGSSTITVKTKANYFYPGSSSITLRQEKQTLTYQKLYGTKTKNKVGYYGCYNISVYNVTKDKYKNINWYGGKTKKISLDANCTYRITVTYDSMATDIFTSAPWGYSWKRSSSPSWRVNSTWKLATYY